jgi:exosortase N
MNDIALKYGVVIRRHILFSLMLIAHIGLGLYFLQDYMPWRSINFMIAVAGLPVIIYGSVSGERSFRFIFLGLTAAVSAYFFPIDAVLFLALVLSAAGLIEWAYGKMSVIPILIVLIISPVSYIITILSFPIRIGLTKIAASIIGGIDSGAIAAGNVITYNGIDYSVDPACMGLKMLSTSLWFSLYLLYFIQKKLNRYLSLHMLLSSLVIVGLLNIVTNLSRIVLLVYLNIQPDNIMHDLVGVGCFALYTVLPVLYLFKKLVERKGRRVDKPEFQQGGSVARGIIPFAVLTVIVFSGIHIRASNSQVPVTKVRQIEGYTCDMFSSDVVRMINQTTLIYIKSIPAFYSSEHNPLMCWVGSGYEFTQLKEQQYKSVIVYTGVLQSKDDVLYTAWWYDNGKKRTVSQLSWRWDMVKGADKYSVVNVTCNTEKDLNREVNKILATDFLNKSL